MPNEKRLHYHKATLEREVIRLVNRQQLTRSSRPLVSIKHILKDAKRSLTHAYRVLAQAARQKRDLSVAAEWLIDNFYIIQEQIVQLGEDLPESYYKNLPRLAEGRFAGYARIYEPIFRLAQMSDNIIDQVNAETLIEAFQDRETLTLGELWAVPIMIRLVLIQRLEVKVSKLLTERAVRKKADEKLQSLVETESEEPGALFREVVSHLQEGAEEMNRDYLVAIALEMQSRGLCSEPETRWFNYHLRRWNTTLKEEVRLAAQHTSSMHLSIQNAISSLRSVSEQNWADFVERNAVVERILRLDPAGIYEQMDFKTRDTYRKKIEQLSMHSSWSEREVAQKVLELAERQELVDRADSGSPKQTHVGYFLVSEGFSLAADELQYRAPIIERVRNVVRDSPAFYFALIGIHLAVLFVIISLVTDLWQQPIWVRLFAVAVMLLPALDLAIVSSHRILTLTIPPRILPKLQFKGSIPDAYRTLVTVPTLFSSVEDALRQIEDLEIRALANSNPSLQFAILSDFLDAPEESSPADREILEAAAARIRHLNATYRCKYENRFLLLHRRRIWNEQEGVWMGWERKRGKLEELNRFLMEPDREHGFFFTEGAEGLRNASVPVRYILTLDADTQLPPGSALDLIRTAAHPLNTAELDPKGERVVNGYGIFQPRISIPPKSANRSAFSRIYSGNVGLDPYTTAVSDVYQDLFGEGVFTGKGLYDLQAFHQVLGGRFPENLVLSHDLLESTYLRAALLSDVELFDDYPTTYLSYAKRNHRWIRGDWQIFSWLLPRVPTGTDRTWRANPISLLSRWKILDNLRRSLTPASLLIMLVAGWFLLPAAPFWWTLAVLGIMVFPIYSTFSIDLLNRPNRVSWILYLQKIRGSMKMNTIQSITTIIFLPHQAYLSLDAILKSLWRMIISKRDLLQWTSASHTEREDTLTLTGYHRKLAVNQVWSLAIGAGCAALDPLLFPLAVPFLLLWLAGPVAAWYLSKRTLVKRYNLKPEDRRELREYARRTWHYFEQYMDDEHYWLPPDNVQISPYIGAVDRTSPTNIGLFLASTIAAYRLGYVGLERLLELIGNTLGSMKLLDRYKGHFYNWYSTRLGEVLNPRYISTVDSGNLAGSLIIVKQFLNELESEGWPNLKFWDGLRDTIATLRSMAHTCCIDDPHVPPVRDELLHGLDRFEALLPTTYPDRPEDWQQTLERLAEPGREIASVNLDPLGARMNDAEFEELYDWLKRPLIMVEMMAEEIGSVGVVTPEEGVEPAVTYRINDLKQQEPFRNWMERVHRFSTWCQQIVEEMNFSMLYNEDRELFSIGYSVDRATADPGTYDLLSSEARIASFLAIAKGEVPPDHWFSLSRRLTSIKSNEILLSWGGTMFEYLMPLLFMHPFDDTLMSNTYTHVVNWQKEYGRMKGQPWGVSESAYNVLNIELHYQYRAFGVPGLGLRRGLAEDYVVAPYASLLALMVKPREALENLRRLREQGGYGFNGFWESLDYTPSRAALEEGPAIVNMYMAHHQGMGLLALTNVLENNEIQRLFHADPLVQSCELLLQERIPVGIPIKEPRPIDVDLEPGEEQSPVTDVDHCSQQQLNLPTPRGHLLSNGRHTTMITHAGSGYSNCDGVALTRWKGDRIEDSDGFFFYVRDLDRDLFWSVGHQPVCRKADRYDTWFQNGKVQIARVDEWAETFMEVCVSPEDDLELRKITLTNYAEHTRRLELTSYAEVVLNDRAADTAHPAFSKLFVQTDYIPEHHAVVARRRPRSEEEQEQWLIHTIAGNNIKNLQEPLQYETDRERFIGRGRRLANPAAMDPGARLSGSIGNVPDPIVSIRCIVELGPGEKKSITFGLGYVGSYEEAVALADRYDNPYATDRMFELASIQGEVELDHIGISGEQAHYFQQLASIILYRAPDLRAEESVLRKNRKHQSGLWAYGISGDIPIMLYSLEDTDHLAVVERLLKAHAFWVLKGFEVDLVIINDHPPSYIDELHEAIHQKIQLEGRRENGRRGRVFLLRGDEVPAEDRTLLEATAAVVARDTLPEFDEKSEIQENISEGSRYSPAPLKPSSFIPYRDEKLHFFNGFGGFSEDGREYIIEMPVEKSTGRLRYTPAPWVNVIANPDFGFLTSELGSDVTWSINSRENRLSSWSNDAVTDPPSEALYIRDDEQGTFWSPTPGPAPGGSGYRIHHGFGYTKTRTGMANLEQEVTKWVSTTDPVKIVRVRLVNNDLTTRVLTLFRYNEWVMGVNREQSAPHVATTYEQELQAIWTRNHYNNEFAGRVAFASLVENGGVSHLSATADREEFIGRNNDLSRPRAVTAREELTGRFGAGMDPCAAFQCSVTLRSGEEFQVYYLIGEEKSPEKARELLNRYRHPDRLEQSYGEAIDFWREKLGRVQIATPDRKLDMMANGWLQYQNIGCRLWGRSGFYQSGGAYGFRDQLQDVAAVLHLDPEITRKQIVRHARHQFIEGDVLHWWHPPTGRGIRSRITDDLLWMPYVTNLYLQRTGDWGLLDRDIPFISARPLEEGVAEAYLKPDRSKQSASLYEHCCRAIDRSLTEGAHGLPLIGTGDWNDGMNRVGEEGKGESVWLGFFLYKLLQDFLPICRQRGDDERVDRYRAYRSKLKVHLNREGWDGEWYRRAFYDDGTPLGSAENAECRIDGLAQSWSVLSGAAPQERARKAMSAAEKWLISEPDGLIRLLRPPFDKTDQDPGYIKGYIPGVRENGGQYTHAALWMVRAFAELGESQKALRYLTMLLPVSHADTPKAALTYRVEPYVVAADIYGEAPLTGRGGWTWYTGSAGWMYRVLVESILGLKIRENRIVTLDPRIPEDWPGYTLWLTLPSASGDTKFELQISTGEGRDRDSCRVVMDGKAHKVTGTPLKIPLKLDGQKHHLAVELAATGRSTTVSM